MARRNYRSNNTYLIEGYTGDNPKLMAQSLSDGRDSLYLEYYYGYDFVESANGNMYKKINRSTERLNLYIWQAPRTPMEREHNNETLALAKKIRFDKAQEILELGEGYRLKRSKDVDLIKWMWGYYERYTKSDARIIKSAYNSFVDYLVDPKQELTIRRDWTEEQKESAYTEKARRIKHLTLNAQQMTKPLIVGYTEYLQQRYNGEGALSVYKRFKKIISVAVELDILRKNPCHGIVIRVDTGALRKDVLSIEEVERLIATYYKGENPEIRRAFIFSLYTGVRYCDIKDLTFANIDFGNKLLRFEQSKTKGHSSASGVVIPLNDGLLQLIGDGKRTDKIFHLPSHTMCLKALRHWTNHAGIDKHITWHCARHSFAVNILNNGANIKTVASLLGHSGLSQTEKYTRAIDSLKEAAINSLPELKL